MNKQLLFIQGGGKGGYEADTALVASLKSTLGVTYKIKYPEMFSDESISDFTPYWLKQIAKEISSVKDNIILAGHSLGASMLLKYLSENKIDKNIAGIFLIATPFWSGNEDWVQPLKLLEDFSEKLPKGVPIFFYQCKDDEEVPFDQFIMYKKHVPWAVFREIPHGGHQLNNDLAFVANDIKSL